MSFLAQCPFYIEVSVKTELTVNYLMVSIFNPCRKPCLLFVPRKISSISCMQPDVMIVNP